MKRGTAVLALFLTLLAFLAACQTAPATPHPQPADSANVQANEVSLNGLPFPTPEAQKYRFLVVGHLYGSADSDDRRPATALLDQIPTLKDMDLSMLVSLGDMVRQSNKADFADLERMLLDKLPFPVFNIPGNHDVEDRELYEFRYGQTFYSFAHGPARMIFLDTERTNCTIDEPQINMLDRALQSALDDAQVQHIFIFMHKTLFFENERLFDLKKQSAGPNVWDCYGTGGFEEIMDGTILPAAAQKPVYLFAGDVGAWGNLTPYYERRVDLPLTMLMTGLGDTPQDAGILVTIDGPTVRLEAYPLAGQSLPALETFSPEYWVEQAEGQ